jgi:hypothetical protein
MLELRNVSTSQTASPDLAKISSLMTAVDSAVSGRASVLARLIADDHFDFRATERNSASTTAATTGHWLGCDPG